MMVTENIKSFRAAQGKSQKYVADALGISSEEYKIFEVDASKMTLEQLQTTANALSVTIADLVAEKNTIGQIRNYFYNHPNNQSTNIKIQGIDQEEIRKAYKELYQEELDRIPKLEKLLRDSNIIFNI